LIKTDVPPGRAWSYSFQNKHLLAGTQFAKKLGWGQIFISMTSWCSFNCSTTFL